MEPASRYRASKYRAWLNFFARSHIQDEGEDHRRAQKLSQARYFDAAHPLG